jgi:glutathione S-transferase
MSQLTLHFAPDTCARVPLIALETIGCPYELQIVAFMKAQHRSPEYLALNPKGKVPTLVVDGVPLSENIAILRWLAETFPEAQLLPPSDDRLVKAQQLADLSFCASGLHPIVTRIRIPQYFCESPECLRGVYDMAIKAMQPNFALIDRRLANQPWWFGEEWSIIDAYLNWVWFRVTGAGMDTSQFPHFARHDAQLQLRPAVLRALAINTNVKEQLEAQGLGVKFVDMATVAKSAERRSG